MTKHSILPSTGHENNLVHPKQISGSALHLFFFFFFYIHFPPFNCCLNVVLWLDKGDYPENSHVVFCPYKQRSFQPFTCLGLVVLCCAPLLDKKQNQDVLRLLFISVIYFVSPQSVGCSDTSAS